MRLPAAACEGWPIRLDHCFMRVCLDNALGRRWDEAVRPPAIRNMPAEDLARAVGIAERILGDPAILDGLNRNSLAWRRTAADRRAPLRLKRSRAGP